MATRRIKVSRALTSGEALLVDMTGRSQITLSGPPRSSGALAQVGTVTIGTNRPLDGDGRALGTAPAGMFFTAEASGFLWDDIYAQPWKDLHFRWSFDDPKCVYTRADTDDLPWDRVFDTDNGRRKVRGPAVYGEDGETYIEEAVLEAGVGFKPATGNPVFVGHDGNIAYGPWVCHVFAPENLDFGGADFVDLTVRCEVRAEPSADPLTVATKTVRIANPAVVFSGARTFLISTMGNTADPKDPAWEPSVYPNATLCNTHAGAVKAATVFGSRPARFLFRRGENHTPQTKDESNLGDSVTKLHIGAYGDKHLPAKMNSPVYGRFNTSYSPSPEHEFSIFGLDLIGPYDPTQPNSVKRPGDGLELLRGSFKTVWDMSITGYNVCISGEVNEKILGFENCVIGDTYVGYWSNYGMFIHGSPKYFGQCGVWVKQPYGTVISEGRDEVGPPVYADHGPIRCMSPGSPSAFNMVDYRSLNSWSGNIQPCNRYNIRPTTGDSPNPGDIPHYQWERARFEGGIGIWQNASLSGSGILETNPVLPVLALFDKCYALTISDGSQIGMSLSGMVVRNTIAVQHASSTMGPTYGALVLGDTETPIIGEDNAAWSEKPLYYDARVLNYGRELYSCSFVDLRTSEHGGNGPIESGIENAYAYWTEANNLWHAPSRPDIETTDGPVDMTALWTTGFDGRRYKADDELSFNALYAISADTPGLFAPVAGSSPAYRGADPDQRIAVDDFFGRLRSGMPCKGAIETD